ncbi:MAG: tryptophan 2,3-dioxygenase [Chloroflexi bacterium]|nr:tryptophan 2,3-dioxygenase [Chloroflexota bacterium]
MKTQTTNLDAYGARLDFERAMSYGDYLDRDALLSAQHLRSANHNEMLFLVIHHVQELWLKLVLHELSAARERIKSDDLMPSFKMTARVSRILEQMVSAWGVLATMTLSEYLQFRGTLGNASGFQSYQYRLLEFVMGNKNAVVLRPHAHRPEIHAALEQELRTPSLYDEALRLMARRGSALPPEVIERDWAQPYHAHPAVEQAWLEIYREPETHWDLYELAEELIDLEDLFRQWRFRHLTTVERIIGFKQGTGGTPGVPYLKKMLDMVLFPELWKIRTAL